MVDMMLALMPLMMPFFWASVVIAVLGLLFALLKSNKLAVWSIRLVFVFAGFFLIAQLIGTYVEIAPSINLRDAKQYEYFLVSFWQIGVSLLVAGIIIKFLSKAK